ncbi:peptidylprolyl isomerase [Escherichia coli]|nr:peptidyl-prolyl cis-trans isomerase [Escherichia coli]HDT2297185.1 peptidyl-prolyl cis-trans isomerase [Escherichia coli]HEI3107932.1 peptidyl-prolyl cis-trans isomerase [Escherichia coli]
MTQATIRTNYGNVAIQLHDDRVPETVAHFIELAKAGFYTGTIFHRVISGFMVQGGGYESGMKQKPAGEPIQNEAKAGAKNKRGTVAMARTQAPHSATSQFFINLADNDFLNHTGESAQGWGYCVFGEVVEGMDVVDAIAAVETGSTGMHKDVPRGDVTIISVEIE